MPAAHAPLTGDPLLVAVTDAMVALHERYHHRAPVTAKTLMLGGDLIACVLGGVYTDVEKTMIELQRSTIVQETRSAFQTAMQHKFIAAVERLSGRDVLAFISNQHVGPDIEIELFMLNRTPTIRPSRPPRRPDRWLDHSLSRFSSSIGDEVIASRSAAAPPGITRSRFGVSSFLESQAAPQRQQVSSWRAIGASQVRHKRGKCRSRMIQRSILGRSGGAACSASLGSGLGRAGAGRGRPLWLERSTMPPLRVAALPCHSGG